MEQLKKILRAEDTVLFIGSGISVWSGLPTWSGLIEELACFVDESGGNADIVRSEAKKGELLQAASYGFDQLTKPQIGAFICDACHFGKAKPHSIHRSIVSLGPRCFVTTNYDNLIEESLRKWHPDRFYKPPVTNRHLTETAEIVHARANDYIFKPHGDAGDAESIVLTREQYRQLLPGGERQAALESLKMILASRPVVYFGFGLRDPDFLYVRDLLAITFKGGIRDHYAVMADVSEGEISYWRKNYGIHLINYSTVEKLDGSRDHSALISLLDGLSEAQIENRDAFDPSAPDTRLALARYGAGLAGQTRLDKEFVIRVNAVSEKLGNVFSLPDPYDHEPVETFLGNGPDRAVLLGVPGAGKTYAMRMSAARLGSKLNSDCIAETFDPSNVQIPVLIDLKLYSGDIRQSVTETLPISLPFDELVKTFDVRIFLDAFNEIPREFLENGSFESDFHTFFRSIGRARVIIGSRTLDGLEKFDFPVYQLDEIDAETVRKELKLSGISIEGPFAYELGYLLQRPFFFQQIVAGSVAFVSGAHPKDFFRELFEDTERSFYKRFGFNLDLVQVLSRVAFECLDRGQELFQVIELISEFQLALTDAHGTEPKPLDVINWLVSRSILIPSTNGRIGFIHQSVTEYLAATALATEFQKDTRVLTHKLQLTRWDQAIFLTLSLLPTEAAESFFHTVMETDLHLALNASKYLEVGRDDVIDKLLGELAIPEINGLWIHSPVEMTLRRSLPLTERHEQRLRDLIALGGSIGAVAVIRLVEIKGEAVKAEMLEFLKSRPDDYNLCVNGVADAIARFVTVDDLKLIATWAQEMELASAKSDDAESLHGFTSGAAHVLSHLDFKLVANALLPTDDTVPVSNLNAKILVNLLRDEHSSQAFLLALKLLLRGIDEMATTIYFLLKFSSEEELMLSFVNVEHIQALLTLVGRGDDFWALEALKCICEGRADLKSLVLEEAEAKSGIQRAVLRFCGSADGLIPIFEFFDELERKPSEESFRNVDLLRHVEFDWTDRQDSFLRLLRLREPSLATALLGGTIPPNLPNLGKLKIEDIHWWLGWIEELRSDQEGGSFWLMESLAALLAIYGDEETRRSLLREFNDPASRFRKLLMNVVLPHFNDISTDDFEEDSISYLIGQMKNAPIRQPWRSSLLGNSATEEFVVEYLLPLNYESETIFADNLRDVLFESGKRHGRRYPFVSSRSNC